jgi:hypothetical protein
VAPNRRVNFRVAQRDPYVFRPPSMLAVTHDREPFKVNIHTHLIPFLLWTSDMILTFFGSSIPATSAIVLDTPILTFTVFSLFTLFSSVVWHTMSGCAHHRGMVLCAKIDYVGIAWYVETAHDSSFYPLCSHISTRQANQWKRWHGRLLRVSMQYRPP